MLDDAYSLLERGVDAIIMEYINPEPFLDFQVEAASRGVCVLNESQTPLTGAQNWNEDNYHGRLRGRCSCWRVGSRPRLRLAQDCLDRTS